MVQTDTGAGSVGAAAEPAAELGSPRASRLRRPRWLDPRLITGVLLVLGSVVVGTRVIAAADHTVPVLVAATDMAPGQALSPDLVETRNVVLDGNLDRYVTGSIGGGYVLVRAVSEGELLPRSAVAAATGDEIRHVTIALPAAEVPVGLTGGAVVDVWRVPAMDATDRTAQRLLSRVGVTDADVDTGGLTSAGSQTRVTLALVAAADQHRSSTELDEAVGALVAAARDGLVYLTVVTDAGQ